MLHTKFVSLPILLIMFVALAVPGCNAPSNNPAALAEVTPNASTRAPTDDLANALATTIYSDTFQTVEAGLATLQAQSTVLAQTGAPNPTTPEPVIGAPPMTLTLNASPMPNTNNIIAFRVVPTTTLAVGEVVRATWQARGDTAVLCPYVMTPSGPNEQTADCANVPLAGTRDITIQENKLHWNGLSLRVTNGPTTERALIPLVLGCRGLRDWFFEPAPPTCPEAAPLVSRAAVQFFERGMMIWMQNPDRFYVFYNDTPTSGTFDWRDAPYTFHAGASPDNRVNEPPPPGRVEPVSGFGQIWRGEMEGFDNVRARLGWATAPEFSFDTAYQCAMPNPAFRLWTCYVRAPDGKILRLRPDSTAQVRFIWEEQ